LTKFQTTPRYTVCLRSYNGPFGTLDVEGPCRSTTGLERIGLTVRSFELALLCYAC